MSGKDLIYAPDSNESCVSLFPCKLAQGGRRGISSQIGSFSKEGKEPFVTVALPSTAAI